MNLYPLRGLPKQRQIWSWIAFDVANQSFTLIINTLLFSIFFSKVVVRNDAIDDQMWAMTFGISMALTALLSPWTGAVADARAVKKKFLIGSGLLCGILTCCFGFIQPGQLWLAILLYIPANFAFSIGENFLASFLPDLARQDQVGRVSGFSWACAYGAALLLLIATAGIMLASGLKEPDKWKPFFVGAGVWFLLFLIPTALWLKEPPADPAEAQMPATGWQRLKESLTHLKSHRDLGLTLLASLFYGTGMNVVVFFASKLADEYGFSQVKLVIFVAVITVSGIVGTIIPTLWQDRIGHRKSVLAFLLVWLFTTCGFAVYAHLHQAHVLSGATTEYPTWPLWVIGNLLGFGLGSLGSANRAFVGFLAPPGREAETFGLWGLVWKLSAITTFPFAWMKDRAGTEPALWLLAGFLVVGLCITLKVDEKRGQLAAQGTPDASDA